MFKIEKTMRLYPLLVQRFDSEYGGPTYKNKRKSKGRDKLRLILDHLAKHRNSTCKDIANQEWERKVNSKIKLKSITDDVRKFIYQNDLIKLDLIRISGKKKEYNKNANTFELTPFGILYSIHMLENNIKNPRFFETIVKEYKDEIPIFKKIDVFKKMFGEKYYKVLGIENIAKNGIKNRGPYLEHKEILDDFVEYSDAAWLDIIFINTRWKEEINFAVLNNILEYVLERSMWSQFHNKKFEDSFKHMWESLMKNDKETKKQYVEFVKEALEANQKRTKKLKELSRLLTHYDVNIYKNL